MVWSASKVLIAVAVGPAANVAVTKLSLFPIWLSVALILSLVNPIDDVLMAKV